VHSNLDRDIGNSDKGFHGFLQSSLVNSMTFLSVRDDQFLPCIVSSLK
jgi:hypothetical protein